MTARTQPPAGAMDPLRQLADRSRVLGARPDLVVNGGGNTSAKGNRVDHLGRTRRAMWIKASGHDMASAPLAAFPALWLDELVELRQKRSLSDADMDTFVARAMADPGAPRPSIETLLHAFLPFAHVDHVHADAICALTNQRHARDVVSEALGPTFAFVDWIRPGFQLSKTVARLADSEGVVLAHHGLVTWGESSDACLRRTLETVQRAADYLAQVTAGRATGVRPVPDLPEDDVRRLLLHLRGALARRQPRVLRVDPRLRLVADRADVSQVLDAGVASADHMLWTRPWSALLTDAHEVSSAAAVVDSFEQRYTAYFEHHQDKREDATPMHDPAPRVVLVPGLGAITTGRDAADAARVAEAALHTHAVAASGIDAFGAVEPLPDQEVFGFDYWPLELYKLSLQPQARRFSGTIQIVTGAASGIGRRIALDLALAGASVVVADLDGDGLASLAAEVGAAGMPAPVTVVGDQSDEAVVVQTVQRTVDTFGGLDGVVLNAGVGTTGKLDELEVARWQRTLQINLTSAFVLTREAIRIMKAQGLGGSLVYVASKNAFAPSAGFGPYSVTKAGMIQLMRIAALEGGAFGIRANAVNPDAVFDNSRLWSGGLREQRAAEHGVRPEDLEDFYANRNLLHRRVTTQDVSAAVAFLLSPDSSRTTGAVIPVDGGVAGGFPR